nr:RNA-directed DNA polymerase [Conexibacter arvalis]
MDIPDRLPFEVLDRLHGDTGPSIRTHIEVRPGVVVIASKKSGTFRPFVRLDPMDLIVYQALVDALGPAIETTLPPREFVGAYRQALSSDDDAFAGNASNDEFRAGVSEAIERAGEAYVLQTDISGYFLGIRPGTLKSQLLEVSDRADVVGDLAQMLGRWQDLGIRGLPQGVRPSSPLGNVYLASLDRLLGSMSVPFFRWMDDMWAICDSFGAARRVQDHIERHLYGMALTLNGEKTRILRAETAIRRLKPARERFEQKKQAAMDAGTVTITWGDYEEEEILPDPDEIDRELTLEEFDRLMSDLEAEDLPSAFSADMGLVFRKLEAIGDAQAVVFVPDILRRVPDIVDTAMRYVAAVARTNREAATSVFAEVLHADRSSRDFEKLATCNRALSLPSGDGRTLASVLGGIALNDANPLIRAKALVAWGKHSAINDISVVEAFLRSSDPGWRMYAFVALQEKARVVRDNAYDRWGGASPGLKQIADLLRGSPIRWSKL